MNKRLPALLLLIAAIPGVSLAQAAKQAECAAYSDAAYKTIKDAVAENCPFAFNRDPLWIFTPRNENYVWCLALPLHDAQIAARAKTRNGAFAECRRTHLLAKTRQGPLPKPSKQAAETTPAPPLGKGH
jgi:hypothetical protein